MRHKTCKFQYTITASGFKMFFKHFSTCARTYDIQIVQIVGIKAIGNVNTSYYNKQKQENKPT